jgi:hypothetical protein
VGADNCFIGVWNYNDSVNGIIPGACIVQSTPTADVRCRSVPLVLFEGVVAYNHYMHGEKLNDCRTRWKRGTYVPEALVLVKGSTRRVSGDGRVSMDESRTIVKVLVLARTESPEGEYRRVGVGRLGSWDVANESLEVLTVVQALVPICTL